MKIFPAIDIISGRVVRLREGKYESAKNYDVTPLTAATNFKEAGAECLHIVDLDGAKSGNADNAAVISEIIKATNMFTEVGGGIRTIEQIEKYLDAGASRVVLGTIAISNITLLEQAIKLFGEKIAVAVDAKDNRVYINGWQKEVDRNSIEFCKKLKDMGVSNVIYTDISKDGLLNGTNLEIYDVLCQAYFPKITASGGISSMDEVEILCKMGLYGAILGKALYEDKLDLREVISTARKYD